MSARRAPLAVLGPQLLLAVVVVGHLVVLYAPRAPSTGGVPGVDKVVHVAVFAALVWAGRRARLAAVPGLVVALVHAPVSEALQHWVLPGRSGDPLDVVADVAGVVLGAVLPLRARAGRRAGVP